MRKSLSVHHHSNELLVVHVALRVFLVVHQLLDLFIAQLLSERRQQVSELSGRDEAAGVLVEVTQPLNEVVGGVSRALLRDCLEKSRCDQNYPSKTPFFVSRH